MRRELVCTEAATPPRLAVRSVELPLPGTGEVLVRVQATSVNPIDTSAGPATAGACSGSRARRAFRWCSTTTSSASSNPSAPA
jgi:hypothetical protein